MRPSPAAVVRRRFQVSLGVASAMGPVSDSWMSPEQRWTEEEKILSLHPVMQSKVRQVLSSLRARGFLNVRIDSAWRSLATQSVLARKRPPVTTVAFSWHTTVGPDGAPAARAVDIIGVARGWELWSESNPFWAALREEARKVGLGWLRSGADKPHLELPDPRGLSAVAYEQVPQILGPFRRVQEGGYIWRQWPNGWVQVEKGSNRGKLFVYGLAESFTGAGSLAQSLGTRVIETVSSVQRPMVSPGWSVPGPFSTLALARGGAAGAGEAAAMTERIDRVAPVRRGVSAPSGPLEVMRSSSAVDQASWMVPALGAGVVAGVALWAIFGRSRRSP